MGSRKTWLSGTCLAGTRLAAACLTFGMLAAATPGAKAADPAADPNGWAMYGHGYDNTRSSPLNQIPAANVGQLKLAYSFQLGSLRSNESSPIVIGDTMYVSTSWGPKYVYAINAATGERN